MPKCLVVTRWDDKTGVVLVAKYPEDFEVSSDDLMRIFTAHAMGSPEPGFLTMRLEELRLNVASYYTGMGREREQYNIMLFLDLDEDPTTFEDPLIDAAKNILDNIDKPELPEVLEWNFNLLSKRFTFTAEQYIAKVFASEDSRLVFYKLHEGGMDLDTLKEWLELQTGKYYSDINLVLAPLVKANLIARDWVPEISKDCVFLVMDAYGARIPAERIISAAKSHEIDAELAERYLLDVSNFFNSYQVTEEELINIAQVISDPNMYLVVKTLRESIIPRDDLAELLGYSAPILESILEKLKSMSIITELEKDFIKWLFLLTDVRFNTFFPEYLVETIREKLTTNQINKYIALRHLELLKEQYLSIRT